MDDFPIWVDSNGSPVNHIPQEFYGFFYIIDFKDGTSYCGIKKVISEVKLNMRKNGKEREGHVKFFPRLKKELIRKEANWRSYTGSYDESEYEDNNIKSRTIVQLFHTKKAMSFYEVAFQISSNVLFSDKWRNKNISGKWFSDFGKDTDIFL